jgi:hypothetical protein
VVIRLSSERVQTEQTPQALRASGILHSQHKPGTVSMFNLHVKKRTVTDEDAVVADRWDRKLPSCAAARMGPEWHCINEELASQFTLHLVDLPGYGRSHGYGAMTLEEMAQRFWNAAPQHAIWLGWSLGLVASQIALRPSA